MSTSYKVYFDIEALSKKTPFKKDGTQRSCEIVINSKGETLYKDFSVHGAVITQIYFLKIKVIDGKDTGDIEELAMNVIPYTGDVSEEAKKYAEEHHTWNLPNAVDIRIMFHRLANFLPRTGDVIFIAYNGTYYDFPVLNMHMRRFICELPKGPRYHTFDTLVELQKYFKNDKPTTSYKLQDMYKLNTGNYISNAHTADADTKALKLVTERYFSNSEILKRASPYVADIVDSVFLTSSDTEVISHSGAMVLEMQGYTTRASLFEAKKLNMSIQWLSIEDLHIVDYYCNSQLNSIKQPAVLEDDITDKLDKIKIGSIPPNPTLRLKVDDYLQDKLHHVLTHESTSQRAGVIKVPGVGPTFIARNSVQGKSPTVSILVDMFIEMEGSLDKFRTKIQGINPGVNNANVEATYNWLKPHILYFK